MAENKKNLSHLLKLLGERNQCLYFPGRSFACCLCGVFTFLFGSARPALAGLSGENVVVVVNADSVRSRTIANHYVDLRKIPAGNVVFLSDIPDGLDVSLEVFRDKILKPVMETINQRGLAKQTRCIAYSADFPTGVNIGPHHDRLPGKGIKKTVGRRASITGMTYYYRFVFADSNLYLGNRPNLYSRTSFEQYFKNPFSGEKAADFAAAEQQWKAKEYGDAAESFEALFAEHKTMAPLAIRSAQSYSKAGQREEALEILKAALKRGWWSATYLKEKPELNSLLNDPGVKKLMPYLSTYPTNVQGPRAFTSDAAWAQNGFPVPLESGGMPYMMSCSLAMLHEYGNTLGEAVAILQRASKADRTFPRGDFRFAGGTDVRAKTRFPGVADALLFLQNTGFRTEVFKGIAPTNPGDVVGLMIGSPGFTAERQKWQLVPGSISESLTSLAGDYHTKVQTKITAYLLAGAAMSSGTVTEPYALQRKFPLAMLYGYYSTGLSAMEAFYLSVASPYQLLIIGDPVCQPFAAPPADIVGVSVASREPTKIRITRRPRRSAVNQTPAGRIEVYLNGRLVRETPAVRNLEMNLLDVVSGVVEIRSVLSGLHPTQPRISMVRELDLHGPKSTPVAKITQQRKPAAGLQDDGTARGDIKIRMACPGADAINLMLYSDIVASVKGDRGTVTVSTSKLGGGPLKFRPVASFGKIKVAGFSITDR